MTAIVCSDPAPPRVCRPLSVLVVDGQTRFAEAVVVLMRRRGWRPHQLQGTELLAGLSRSLLSRIRPDVALVEPAVMPAPAPEWVHTVRAALPDLPIVVCTPYSSPEERIEHLRAGVEHWLSKPVASEELFATLEAVARHRCAAEEEPARGPVVDGELCIDATAHMCTVDGTIVALTVKELGVLTFLAARRGHVVTRGEIFVHVWGWPMLEHDRTIDVYVRRLRAKLAGASPGWAYIHTHKGRGYRFEAVTFALESRSEHVGTAS